MVSNSGFTAARLACSGCGDDTVTISAVCLGAEEGDGGGCSLDDVDLQDEEEEGNHEGGEREEAPEDFPCEGFAEGVDDDGLGNGERPIRH